MIFRVRGNDSLRNAILTSMAKHGIPSISQWFVRAALMALAWDVETVTDADLKQISASNTRQERTHCPSGHEYSSTNTKMRGNVKTCKICHRLQVKKSALRRKVD